MRYGAALGLVEALTMVWVWLWREALVAGEPPICWPIFQSCEAVRVLDLTWFSCLVIGVALLGLGASAAFLIGRARFGYWSLLLAGVLKIAIVLLDFRLRRNQHYMAVAVLAVFLFWPYKRDAIRLLIVGFYFAAGLLKFDMDWISGEGLTKPIWFFTGPWLVAAQHRSRAAASGGRGSDLRARARIPLVAPQRLDSHRLAAQARPFSIRFQ
jgi:hypothetical protein